MRVDRVLLFKFFLQDSDIIHYKHQVFLRSIHSNGNVEYVKYLIYCYVMRMFYKNAFICKTVQSHCTIGVAFDLAKTAQTISKFSKFKFERFVYRMEKWKAASMYMDFHKRTILRIPENITEDDYVEPNEITEFFTLYPEGVDFEYVSKLRIKYITFINPSESRFKQYE